MKKLQRIICINLDEEATPANYAKEIGVTTSVITNWISRSQIEYRKIEELNLILVKKKSELAFLKKRKEKIDNILKNIEDNKP